MLSSSLRVGVDLVDLTEIEGSVRSFGSRFTERIFVAEELAYAASSPARYAARLAARFAAKEAVMKLLCVGDAALPWRCIAIRRSHTGACDVELSGEALRLARELGVEGIAISITHQGNLAAAVAVALAPEPGAAAREDPLHAR